MDKTVFETDNVQRTELILEFDDILIVDFIKAVNTKNPKILNKELDDLGLELLTIEYQYELEKIYGVGIYEEKIKKLNEKYFKTLLLIEYLVDVDFNDKEIRKALFELHPNLNNKLYKKNINEILKENDKILNRIEEYKLNIIKREEKEFDIYESIANLSISFQLKLSPKELSVTEYLTYLKISKEQYERDKIK